MIQVTDTAIDAVKLLTPSRLVDHRGYIAQVYSERELLAAGIATHFVAENHVLNLKSNVLRGLHFQAPPFSQVKLIRVTRGSIYDVALDLRPASPSFGQHVGVVLSAAEANQLYVPEGFAHGFCALEDNTEVHYKISRYAEPGYERGLRWDDPVLGIAWPLTASPILAERDMKHPSLAQWEATLPASEAPATTEQDIVDVIEALEVACCRAMVEKDIDGLRRLCSEHLVYTHTSTRRDTKESFIRRLETGFYQYLELTRGASKVTVIGSTAFVTGQLGSRVIVEGVTKTLNNAILAVWVREDDVWKFVAYQPTPIPAFVPV